MLRTLSRRLTYANVTSTIALFLALGGVSAYAANTINSTDIVDGQVNSADVKDQSLTTFDVSAFLGADVVDGSLTGADIGDGSLTDKDVGELTLTAVDVPVPELDSQECTILPFGGHDYRGDHLLLLQSRIHRCPGWCFKCSRLQRFTPTGPHAR